MRPHPHLVELCQAVHAVHVNNKTPESQKPCLTFSRRICILIPVSVSRLYKRERYQTGARTCPCFLLENEMLKFYEINPDYIDYLSAFAPHLFHNKTAAQVNKRKYIGIVLTVNDMHYFVPLSS
ncbi:MAG: type III toxin-antitoxin system ToxN/AbiQ family toxin, partial [Treponemataceae bacterium]|nr:type III toxin-antitoxin system ToxN/AbiQ family toxin [Treponemataceae bacterium]